MMKLLLAIVLLCLGNVSQAGDYPAQPAAFSSVRPGPAIPAPWALNLLPNVDNATRFDLVSDENHVTVLRAVSVAAAATLTHKLHADASANPWLSWRWKVSRMLDSANLEHQEGDDYAARIYVLFDYPVEKLSLADRVKISLGQSLYGQELPAAALCYVWDNHHPTGLDAWSAYSNRVRMIVVESGPQHAGHWRMEQRDVAADFRAAFGEEAPPIVGIALAADTDNTGENVTAWFGDVGFLGAPPNNQVAAK